MIDPVGWIGKQYHEMGQEVNEVTDKATSGDYYGAANEFVTAEEDAPLDTHIDLVWEGHENDNIDLTGPALWGTDDSVANEATAAATNDDGEDPSTSWGKVLQWIVENPTTIIGALVALYVLPALASGLEVAANVTD